MPAVTRELALTYGAVSVGGSTDRLIDGYIRIDKSYATASVSFDLVITAASDAAFASEISTIEAEFRKPFQDLGITQGSSTLLELKPSNDTGLNTQPSISKSGDMKDTGRSRKYSIRIDCEMPADNSPTVGLRESTVNVAFTPARKRRVTISGVVTAQGGTDARAKYNAIISTYTGSVLSALGGTFELGEEPTTTSDYQDKVISFTRVFDEIIYSEAGSVDDVRIVRQSITIGRGQVGPGDTQDAGAVRLVNMSCSYDAWIDKDQTQDLAGVWASIKHWIYSQIQAAFAAGAIAVMDSRPSYDYGENKISVSISAVGSTGSPIIEHRQTVQQSDVFGVVLVPAWTGNSLSKYEYQGPATKRRTTTVVQRLLGEGGSAGGGGASYKFGIGGNAPIGGGLGMFVNIPGGGSHKFGIGGNAPIGGSLQLVVKLPGGGGGGAAGGGAAAPVMGLRWVQISRQESETPLTIGTDGRTINVIDKQTTLVEEAYKPIKVSRGQAVSPRARVYPNAGPS